MRPIEFRGKRLDNGEWIYGYYVFCRGRHYILPIYNESGGYDERWFENEGWWEIDIKTLGQFTGLTDKSGKEIFEEDILICKDMHDSNVFGHAWKKEGNKTVPVPQVIKCSSPIDWEIPEDISYHPDWWEVIGNIYEHKNLIDNK